MFKRASVSFINKSKYAQILHSQVAEKVSILNCQRNFRFSRPTTSFGIKDSSKKWIIITGVGLAIISSGLKIKRLKAGDSGREENAGRRFYEETDEHDESLGEKDSEPLITETKINEIVLIDEVQTFCSNGTGILNVYHYPVMNHRTTVREISPQPEDLQKNAIFPGKKEDQAIIKRITKEQYEKCTEDFSRSQIDDPKKFVFSNEQGTPLAISKIMHDAKPVKSPTKTLHQYEKQGGFQDAKNDLKYLSTQQIEVIKDVYLGGAGNTKLNARKNSTYPTDRTEYAPTLEIINKESRTKFRYMAEDKGETGETPFEDYDSRDKKRSKKF